MILVANVFIFAILAVVIWYAAAEYRQRRLRSPKPIPFDESYPVAQRGKAADRSPPDDGFGMGGRIFSPAHHPQPQ
jgi:hypothetical protein